MAKKKLDWIDEYSEWPASADKVSQEEGCTIRTAQKWAKDNGVRAMGEGNRRQYLFFRQDVANFRQRKRPGRRWPEN
jgi:hypothetical protein